MVDFPDELKEARDRLRGLSQAARDLARESGLVSERADRGIAYLDWMEEEAFPHLPSSSTSYATASGVEYNHQLGQAAVNLSAGLAEVSSASSQIQMVVAGSSTLATSIVSEIFTLVPSGQEPPDLGFPQIPRGTTEATLDRSLSTITGNEELSQRRRGAWQAFHTGGSDDLAQATHSMREILTSLLDQFSPNSAVKNAPWWTLVPETRDGVSKVQKLKYFIIGVGDPSSIPGFLEVERQVSSALEVHRTNINIAHHFVNVSKEVVRTELTALEDVMENLLELRGRYFQAPDSGT